MITTEESNKNKEKCKELREIRVRLSKELNISYLISSEPCTYQGLCNGTCPRCEYEERILLDEIYKKKKKTNPNNYMYNPPLDRTPGLILPPVNKNNDITPTKNIPPLSGKVVQKSNDSKFNEFLSKTNFSKDEDKK